MTRSQHDQLVKTRTDLILGGELTAEVYAAHFEIQMHRGKVRDRLYTAYIHFARAGAMVFGLDARDTL
jgi:hypothetical protein